ncbi:MAG: glycosyltransferase family 25 protein [Prochlorococcus marinus CUG1439]|uniref:glycosyltransferase family 25 protein n=1 Tax=Prochlorococcus sp. MIT 1314 TaxID=3096220 RepID=UPI001B0614E8|nr:glycosyltransferase family 25 protein [Prochlorococcus sp. MIT 1314]MCR8538756.1 glycosyltransferase family 25 protein [Prochlorococcus marinus CUG1439]
MNDISFYIIHNNSEDRIDIRNQLQNLANNLNIDFFEIYRQKTISKVNFNFKHKLKILRIYSLRIFYNLKHKRDFSFNFCCLLLKSLLNLNKFILNLFFKTRNKTIDSYKHFTIESFVTKKHIKAWEHFLKSKKEIMVIFEDDAICKKDTEKRLKEIFVRSKSLDFNNFFVDLAGGLNLKDVIPAKRIKKYNDEFILLEGIYTNTACSYLISRNLIQLLYKEYQETKLNNYFPIDHLINKLGLEINKTQNILSMHFHHPLFTHGSFKGKIKSWQIY